MAILANMTIGEVNGIKENTFAGRLLIASPEKVCIVIKNPAIKTNVTGNVACPASSIFVTVDPVAPYKNAYIKKPSTKNRSI